MEFLSNRYTCYRILLPLMCSVLIVFSWSCYPDAGMSSLGDYDLIVTHFNPEIDFNSYSTYYMADSIVHLMKEGEEDTITHKFDDLILSEIDANMQALNYIKVDTTDNPDLTIFVYSTSTIWEGWVYYPGWWYWWGYYPIYGGWIVPYEFSTGTVAFDMVDNATYSPADSTVDAIWVAGMLGLLDDTDSNIQYRITRDIDQAFIQSSYLGKE